MTALRLRGAPAPDPTAILIADAIAEAGPARVLRAALVALLRPRARPPDLSDLPASVRRDIGLDVTAPLVPSDRGLTAAEILGASPRLTLPGDVWR